MNNDTDYRSDLLSEDQIMMHDAIEDAKSDTDTLTLFSIMCDENSSEYGHLFIVAATSHPSTAANAARSDADKAPYTPSDATIV